MRTSFIAVGCALATAAPAFAQEEPQASGWTHEAIVVTEERQGYDEPDAVILTRTATPVEKVPQSVQSLTRKQIEGQYLQNLTDALVNVERIDVAKGPTATLYGGGAGASLSGIVNVVSRDPYDHLGVKVTGRAGSFGTVPCASPAHCAITGPAPGQDTTIVTADWA